MSGAIGAWTKIEQLFLIEAVCKVGMDWDYIRHHMQGTIGINNNYRPTHFFSVENCSMQYKHLQDVAASTFTTTASEGEKTKASPIQLLADRFNDEIMNEFEAQIQQNQKEYLQLCNDIALLESENLTEAQMREMHLHMNLQIKQEIVETVAIEENRQDSLPIKVSKDEKNDEANQQAGASSMLSTLLKSPTTAVKTSSCTSVAHVTAPTITTLLTSGALPNQPAITLKKNIGPSEAAYIITPISGPPLGDRHVSTNTTKKSPSEAAPTISMLLEMKKPICSSESSNPNETAIKMDLGNDAEGDDDKVGAADIVNLNQIDLIADVPRIQSNINESKSEQNQESITQIAEAETEQTDDDKGAQKDIGNMTPNLEAESGTSQNQMKCEPEQNVISMETESEIALNIDQSKVTQPELPLEESSSNATLAEGALFENKDKIQEVASEDLKQQENIAIDTKAVHNETTEIIINKGANSLGVADNVTSIQSTTLLDEEKQERKTEDKNESEPIQSSNDNSSDCILVLPSDEDTNSNGPKSEIVEAVPVQKTTTKTIQNDSVEKEKDSNKPEIRVKIMVDANAKLSTEALPKSKKQSIAKHQNDEEPEMTTSEEKIGHHSLRSTKLIPESETATTNRQIATVVSAKAQMLRKVRDSDAVESSVTEDDSITSTTTTTTTTIDEQCTKPIHYTLSSATGSITNSPASEHVEERRETRGASKKILLNIFATLYENKNADIFRKSFNETCERSKLCYRPMDLPTIKRNIENGIIRSVLELHRDLLVMCNNMMMLYRQNNENYKSALAFLQDVKSVKEFSAHAEQHKTEKENPNKLQGSQKLRTGARKQQRYI